MKGGGREELKRSKEVKRREMGGGGCGRGIEGSVLIIPLTRTDCITHCITRSRCYRISEKERSEKKKKMNSVYIHIKANPAPSLSLSQSPSCNRYLTWINELVIRMS